MKKKMIKYAAIVALMILNKATFAQDVCKSNPSNCKLLSDTAGVKMMLITLQPGEKLVEHTHPWHFGYVLKGGVYNWTTPEGDIRTAQMTEGAYFTGAPEGKHHSWNAGKTTIQFVMYEKQH